MPASTGILALIKATDATNPNPTKDAMCYKRGDFVELFPPGTSYVVPVAAPFCLLDVTGVSLTVEEIKARYQQSVVDADNNPTRRRMYYVNLDTLPVANRNALATNGYTLIGWNRLHSSVINKVTGQAE